MTGSALVAIVTSFANQLGASWSGILSMFPVMSMVLAVFSHRASGPAYTAVLLRAMSLGLWSFVAFCLTLTVALPQIGIVGGFSLALLLALVSHAVVRSQR
jgi:hypothetical protein